MCSVTEVLSHTRLYGPTLSETKHNGKVYMAWYLSYTFDRIGNNMCPNAEYKNMN